MQMPGSARKALVLGVNGQDGSYLAQHLVAAGHEVQGVGRQLTPRWFGADSGVRYHDLDLADASVLWSLLEAEQPDVVFHLAAIHGSAGFPYEEHWQDVHAVNVVAAHAVLEYQRRLKPAARLFYASSSKVFGEPLPPRVSESSPRYSTCIYTTTKNAANDLVAYYRQRHAVRASVIWTFNHESPRRGATYFLPKIIAALATALRDPSHVAEIATLGFWVDWGDADEFMKILAALPESACGSDVIFATGQTHWAADVVASLFAHFGLDWRAHLRERFPFSGERPAVWQVDVARLAALGGQTPQRKVFDLALDMLRINHPEAWAARPR